MIALPSHHSIWLQKVLKLFYDRSIGVSEYKVRPDAMNEMCVTNYSFLDVKFRSVYSAH